MPTELEELVEFLHHGNTQIRQISIANLLGYSQAQPSIFKVNQLEPIKDLKLLVKDYAQISKNALTILINLSEDKEILKNLATDDAFLETLLLRITDAKEENANEIAMLLANLAKDETILRLLKLKRAIPKPLSSSAFAIDQLMDCFVKGAEGSYNKHANYDYLSYFFADLAKLPECSAYFITPQAHDASIIPLTKITVFTEHTSHIRRLGVASTIKNVTFDVSSHPKLLAPHYTSPDPQPLLTITNTSAQISGQEQSAQDEPEHINILPYILLPLCGPEEFSAKDMDDMLDDLQLLPPDKRREGDREIVKTHLETLLLLTTTRPGRDALRAVGTYPVVRELHVAVDDEEVRESADRLVQVLMRDEEGEESVVDPGAAAVAAGGGRGGFVGGVQGEEEAVQEAQKKSEEVAKVEEPDSDDEVVEIM